MEDPHADRIARLEEDVAALRAEVTALRRASADLVPPPSRVVFRRALPSPAAEGAPGAGTKGAPDAPQTRRRSSPSLEEIVGRYGTLAFATLTVLVGVGTGLNWAIQHGYFGPTARVIAGLVVAAAVAAGGLRLRLAGTREFGNVLVALALAIVQVVSWNAGPHLHVVPTIAALAGAALVSVVLVEFALRHDEELLCAVGFGGAAIAPFVTADHGGNVVALAAYGVIVLSLFTAALGDRDWRIARRLAALAIPVYLVAAIAGAGPTVPLAAVAQRLGVLFPLALLSASIPLTHARYRRGMLRLLSIAAIAGGLFHAIVFHGDVASMAAVVAAAVLALVTLDLTRPGALETERLTSSKLGVSPFDQPNALLDACFLPLGFLATAVATTGSLQNHASAALSVAWGAYGVWATHRHRAESEREPFAVTAAMATALLAPALFLDSVPAMIVALVAIAVAQALLLVRLPRQAFAAGMLVLLAAATVLAWSQLADRAAFAYVPFFTPASALAAGTVVGWAVALGISRRRSLRESFPELPTALMLLQMGLAAAAFFWLREEIARGWSRQTSAALLTAYYAVTGFVAIGAGRQLGDRWLRYVGLGLSLAAAVKGLVEVVRVPNVGIRVGLLFVVSVFLIGVGYWYRREKPVAVASG